MDNLPAPGVYEDIPFDEYLAWDAVSSHDCMTMLRSPEYYLHSKTKKSDPSQAMLFGSACHEVVLTPETASQHIAVKPDGMDRRTKIGKELFAEFEKRSHGKMIISGSDERHIHNIAEAISRHTIGAEYLERCHRREESCLTQHKATGLMVRGRPDAFCEDLVIDLKTTMDARPESFAKTVHNFGYYVQAFAYLYLLRRLGVIQSTARFCFLVVEKLPPYQVEVYELDPGDILRGGELYTLALQRISRCRSTNQYVSDSSILKTVELPDYARRAHDSRYSTDTTDS